ncbi:MAG TPA: hypothetical protein VMS86_12150, partial [Thermoanaerobaculia bacterium]|nr:hypothetical protein [Thermoanaerobaculia bacterium]
MGALGRFLVAVIAVAGPAQADDAAAVRDLFTRYKTALLTADGATASRLVDRETFAYFEEIKDLALSGDEESVRGRPFVDRLLIVTMRHELPAAELGDMDLEGLLEHAIDAGWIGKASIAQLGIGEVTVDGQEASAVAVTGGQTPADAALSEGLRYRFVRENGEWRFGFRSLVESINQVIAQLTAQMGTDQDALIFVLVEQLSGRKVLPEVWS